MGFFGDIASSIGDVNKNMLEETNKNNSIKNVKFEILVDDLSEWLGGFIIGTNCDITLNLLEILFDVEKVNIYAKKIIEDSFIINESRINNNNPNICYLISDVKILELKDIIKLYRKNDVKFHFIFWSLFIIAVDENAYNEKLSDISDIAYMVNFTEEMMKDWITALRFILEGKDFKNYIYLSKEANKFFGHR